MEKRKNFFSLNFSFIEDQNGRFRIISETFQLESHEYVCPSGGLWAGVSDGEEGGGAGGADGLVEDDVRDTELLELLSGEWSDRSHIDVIYSTFCVRVHS